MAIRVGVIGLGGLGTMHCQALLSMPQAQLAAVCDVRPERLQVALPTTAINIQRPDGPGADMAGIEKYADYQALLHHQDIQAVVIATPTFLHARIAIAALEAGKHVFCEKPISLLSADAKKMLHAASSSGTVFQIGHVLRFWPEYVMIKEMIDDGRLGPPRSAVLRRWSGFPAWAWENWYRRHEMSGSAALDLHIHDVDLVNWYFGTPSQVSSRGVFEGDAGLTHIVTQYDCPGVPLVVAEGGWLRGPCPFTMAITLQFERGTVRYDSSAKPTLAVYHDADGKVQTPPVPAADAYRDEVQYFLDCIASGRPNQRATADQAAEALAIVEAEVGSARSLKPAAVTL